MKSKLEPVQSFALNRRFDNPLEVPIVRLAIVASDHPDLGVIRQAYQRAGAGLAVNAGVKYDGPGF